MHLEDTEQYLTVQEMMILHFKVNTQPNKSEQFKKMQRVCRKLFSQKKIKFFCGYTPIKMKRVEIGSKKHGTKEYNRNNFQDNCVVALE